MAYSLEDFSLQFPNDEACLDYLFKKKHDKERCPLCKKKNFRPEKKRPSYICRHCNRGQIYPRSGTIFENSKTSLLTWFKLIFFITNGLYSAKDIEKMLHLSYPTAWKIQKKIMCVMQDNIKDRSHLSQWETKVRSIYRGLMPENLELYESAMQFKAECQKSIQSPFFILLHLLMNLDGK